MTQPLQDLTASQREELLLAPALVTTLIASSDGTVDEAELAAGTNLAKWKTINARPDLLEYYQQVDARFERDIKKLMESLPEDKLDRCQELVRKIEALNPILTLLPLPFAEQLYASLTELSKRVARATGGVLGYLAVGYDESKLVDLKMLTPPGK